MSARGGRGGEESDPKRPRGTETEPPAQELNSVLANLGNLAKQSLSTALAGGDIGAHGAAIQAATDRLVPLQHEARPVLNDAPRDVHPRHLPAKSDDDEDDDEEMEERPPPSPKKATVTRATSRVGWGGGGRNLYDFSATNALPCNAPSSGHLETHQKSELCRFLVRSRR